MKFYNRERELSYLHRIQNQSQSRAQMTLMIGRRRVGKTALIKKAYDDRVYFFVSKKNEAVLVKEYIEILQEVLQIKIFGEFNTFRQLFEYILELSTTRSFTLIIDEFQEFFYINRSIYSDIQNLWDSYKDSSRINLIFCGSIYSLMSKIFENSKEPLFGRATHKMVLKPFKVSITEQILRDHYPAYSHDDWLLFYILTGGIAKYIEIFVDNGALDFESMLDLVFRENSLFLEEGKHILIEEFGKEYTTYFTILGLIASSKTSRREIESIIGKNVGGYLDRLQNEYAIIKKVKPILSKEGGRVVKYEIIDHFLNFWFRFIYKHKSAVEIENFDYIKQIVQRDYTTYSGKFLERLFVEKLIESKQYSQIGSYWERGNQNEIDIVAINEVDKKLLIAEVKRDKKRISLPVLKEKSKKIVEKFRGYDVEYRGFGLEDL